MVADAVVTKFSFDSGASAWTTFDVVLLSMDWTWVDASAPVTPVGLMPNSRRYCI